MANKTFLLADESLNSYGFWLKIDGADLEQFRRNPIMLWMHSRAWRGTRDEVLPIGYWDNIRVEAGKLMADAVFDTDDEFAKTIAAKVDKGIIRMASVGITVVETSTDPTMLKPGQTRETVTKWKLREASIVDIGANDNSISLAFYDTDGNPLELKSPESDCPVPVVQSPNYSNMKEVAKILNLAEDASISEVTDKVRELAQRNAELESKLAEINEAEKRAREQRATELIDEAIRDGRINANARESWIKMFQTNHEVAEQTLTAIPKRESIQQRIEGSQGNRNSRYDNMNWDELDRSGKLRDLKANYPDLYAQKFEEKFGKKPN